MLCVIALQRLEAIHESNPLTNSNLVEIFKSETSKGNGKKRVSGSKSFVWLTRSLDFTSALLQALLVKDPKKNMEQAVQESYDATLKPWHGWIASAAYRVIITISSFFFSSTFQ
ncbi:glycolipid transfer protein (GLTP) family protein [Medicago truncatula]|uniref:Glycolipid transfer protein (GLTP) family protein n=1 Tax=Medicago truncatula TaxID=3880 RepID=A0A072VB88_MEDTR|nr:glycolipid transfer protein (GLTP) family protein [Medicago truncatula]